MLRSLRAQVTVVTLALTLLIAYSAVATFITLGVHDDDEVQIKVVGDQHTLMHNLLWLASSEPHSPKIARLSRGFEQNLQSLRQGGPVFDPAGESVTVPPTTGLVRSQLDAAERMWAVMREDMARLAALPTQDPAHEELARTLAVDSTALSEQLSAVVDTLEGLSHERHDHLLIIQVVFVGVGLVVMVWGYVVTRYGILRPLDTLGAAARRIGAGQLSEPVPAQAYNEMGQLASAMETMRDEIASAQALLEARVAERTRELSVAFEFSQDITQQLERERLFESIAERARALMQAEAASLCLVTPDGQGVQLVAHSGQRARGEKLWQPVGNEPTLQVVGEGRTMLTDLGGSTCTFLDGRPCDQCLAAPLQIGGHNIGAICILRGSRAPFEEEEERAFTLLTNSAAIAIANAHLLESERRHAQQSAALAERERLAAELHDHLAQTLSFINLKTDRVEGMLADAQPEAATELTRVKAAIEDAYAQVRAALTGLTQPSPGDEDFARRLTEFVAEYRQTTGLDVDVVVTDGAAEGLSPLAQKQALYIVREALANVRRHAGAQAVRVQVAREDGFVHLAVNDDGKGFDPQRVESEGHLGLTIMRTRAERCGGRLSVESAPGQGTTVVARLPLEGGEKELGR